MSREQQIIDKKVKEVIQSLPQDEQVAIGFGFYNFDEVYTEELVKNKYDNFFGFTDYEEDDTPDSTTSVNGKFGTEGEWNGLTEFQNNFADIESDEEFDNLFTKKSRKKLAKGFKKVTKKIGKGIKKGAKKLSLKNIGKGIKKAGKGIVKGVKAVGKGIVKGVRAVGRVIKHAVMFVPRQAARGLIALNYRGMAYKLNWAMKNDKKKYDKIIKKWRKMGGKAKSLYNAFRAGRNKKALFCGAKCKKKMAKQTAKKSSFNADGSFSVANYELDTKKLYDIIKNDTLYANDGGAVSVPVMVGLGSAVIGGLATYLSSIPQSKALKEQVKNQAKRDKEEIKLMAQAQKTSEEKVKKELELVEKKVKDELDPINQIVNNPDLSPAEKQEAIKQVNQALDTKQKRGIKKKLIIGAIALIGIIAVVVLAKKK
jgi:hypothetical protein